MKSKYIFILFILSIVLVGCDKNQEVLFDLDNEKKEYVDVAISVEWSPEEVYRDGVKIEEEPTKALSYEKECQIDNFWIIKLSGPGYERNIEDFQYIEGSSGIARVTSDINEEKILFILANTNNPNLGLNTNMTGNDLYKLYKSINSNEDAENNEYKNLLMCNDGKLRFDFTTNSVNVKLTRCLAKIEFNFELNTEDITIESVQLKNIDRSLYYLEPILRQRTDRPYKYIDYEKHTDNLPKYKETVTYEWYVPRNTSETRVGGDNNKSATYIEVIAKDKVGTFYKYKVYPGSKLQSSYDIIENRKYIINVKFNGVKDVDSNPNLTEFEILDLKDKLSNCYIINPSTKTKHIRIPVTRVNQFWNDSKYGAIDQTKVFDNSTPWKIDLVWTDNQNIISRTENNKILIEKNYGEGIDDYFEIVVPANFNTYGNIFVGIYKDEDDSGTKNGTETYLWTWHLWVTNYNPYSDNIFTPYSGKENNKYIYNVNNGELHRYNGDAWTNGIYSDKFIMDRNLGAITNSQYAWPVYSLYYQYGRMIPTVGEYVGIYKFNSDNINNSNTEWLGQGLIAKSSTQLSMRDAIDKNTTFIFTSPANNWLIDNSLNNYLWNTEEKSLFDPSPYGFKVMRNVGYTGFKGNCTYTQNGMYYNPNSANQEKIFYPFVGNRNSATGNINTTNLYSESYYWTADASETSGDIDYNKHSMSFYFKKTTVNWQDAISVNPSVNSCRSAGMHIRCVQE